MPPKQPINKRPPDRSGTSKLLDKLPGSSRVVCKPIKYKINLGKEEDYEGLDERLAEQQAIIDKENYPQKKGLE